MIRSPIANDFHGRLMAVIRNFNEFNKSELERTLQNFEGSEYLEISINGHSHLHDILHLPYEIEKKVDVAKDISCYLFSVFIQSAHKKLTSKDYKQLLVGANSAGFTPLHEALISGQAENMQAYFEEVRKAKDDGVMTDPEYKTLLVGANSAGFTPLHQAACSGKIEVVKYLFNELENEFKNDDMQLSKQLNAKTNRGYLPSCPGCNNSAKIINDYLAEKRTGYPFKSASQEKWIDDQQWYSSQRGWNRTASYGKNSFWNNNDEIAANSCDKKDSLSRGRKNRRG